MAKTLFVHTLYTDDETMGILISRLVAHSQPFHFTGEFLYSNSTWDHFLREYCSDIDAKITCCIEKWHEDCLNFEGYDNDERLNLYEDGELIGVIKTSAHFLPKVTGWLSKICRYAAAHKEKAQFGKF